MSASPSSERINEESLTPKTSAFESFNRNKLTLNNSVNKTNFFFIISPPIQHHTVFGKTNHLSKVSNVGRFKTLIEDIRYLLIHE